MKKILTLVLFFALSSTAIFAGEGEKVSPKFEASLARSFAGAQYVTWERLDKGRLLRASFVLNNERLNAFFDGSGALIATGRFISQANLPLLVNKSIASGFRQYSFVNAVEYISNDETSYIITMENPKYKLIVRAYPYGSAYIFKKQKKNA
jgi:hypothetical protein